MSVFLLGMAILPFALGAQIVPVPERTAPREVAGAGSGPLYGAPEAQPGDRVVLKIWNEPEMSDTFTVAQSGYVTLPRLGPTRVQGIEINALEDSLRASYMSYLRNPAVQIVVLRRISVLGEVRQPGIYLADLTMGLPDVIARAGGPTDAGDPNRITIVRGPERIEYNRARQSETFVAQLHSGDQVYVRSRNFFVRNPWASISTAIGLISFLSQLGLL